MEVASASIPYVLMILKQLCLAVLLSLLQSVLTPSRGVSAVVLVAYEQLVSALVIFSLALFLERGKRPKPSFRILCYAFFVGLLQIPMGELMLTASLRYITASFQSVALNTIPGLVFVLAVAARQELFQFWDISGQLKIWGIVASAAGATVMVVFPTEAGLRGAEADRSGRILGCLMVGLAVLAVAVANLLVERLNSKYPAHLTLSAMMNVSGTLQTVIVAALMERDPSSWKIWSKGSLPIFTILYAGISATGLFYCIQNWCIHKKGPVFATAFSPLLIVFSFLLETLFFGGVARIGSIIGAMLVVGGLYLLLWAKSKDYKADKIDEGVKKHLIQGLDPETQLQNEG